MINYRMSIKDKEGKTELVQSGYVTDSGKTYLAVPDDVPPGGMIVIEWEPRIQDNDPRPHRAPYAPPVSNGKGCSNPNCECVK